MQLKLGEKIKSLRKRDGRTQDDLAQALGVTCQAVSRWESGNGYPDMEIIPAVANYFGISIDELFGYRGDRERKIDAIIEQIDSFGIKKRGDDLWVDECLSILREGIAEFPQNERLLITLADTLSEAGWRRHQEWLYYDEEGFIRHDYDRHRKNEYWSESVKLCEYLADHASDGAIAAKAISILVLLCRNFGEYEKAALYAERMPGLKNCRELLLAGSADGREGAAYIGDFLLKAAKQFAEQLVYGLIVNLKHYESDFAMEKVKGAIALFELLCDDGNMGPYHDDMIKLHLYLSRLQWERGYHDDAFLSLDRALEHAKALERLMDGKEHTFTAPLVSHVKYQMEVHKDIVRQLPADWPFWCNPDYTKVAEEIKSDPRWAIWVKKTEN